MASYELPGLLVGITVSVVTGVSVHYYLPRVYSLQGSQSGPLDHVTALLKTSQYFPIVFGKVQLLP